MTSFIFISVLFIAIMKFLVFIFISIVITIESVESRTHRTTDMNGTSVDKSNVTVSKEMVFEPLPNEITPDMEDALADKGNVTVNTELGTLSKKDDTTAKAVLDVAVNLGTVMAAVIGVANPVVGAAITVGVVILSAIIGKLEKDHTSVWDQIESQVESRIGARLAQYHVESIKSEVFRPLNRRIMKEDSFDEEDLDEILDRMGMVFPQNYASLGWSYDLPLAIVHYIPYMIAGYHKVIEDGGLPK